MIFYSVLLIMLSFYAFYYRGKWEAAVILFTAFIMQGFIIPDNQQFLGFLDQRGIAASLLIYTGLESKKSQVSLKKLDMIKVYALWFGVLMIIVIPQYIDLKDGLLFGDLSFGTIIKRIFRDSLNMFAVFQILSRMYSHRTLIAFENGLILGMFIALVSMLFPKFFLDLGFVFNIGYGEDFNRLTGFLGLNANAAAGLFSTVFGYVLAKSEIIGRISKKLSLLAMLCIIGLFIVASRTGLIIFIILTLIYFLRNSVSATKTFRNSVVIIVFSIIVYNFFGDVAESRVIRYYTGEHDTLASRISYWQMYLNDIYQNPKYLLIGNTEKPTYHRSVHNAYLHYLFYSGIFSLYLVFFYLYKLFKNRIKYKLNAYYYSPIYALLSLTIIWITIAGSLNYWFILIIGASSGIPNAYLLIAENEFMGNRQNDNYKLNAIQ